jgi:hypothetical protein
MTPIILFVLAVSAIAGASTYYVTDRSIRRTIKKKLGQRGKSNGGE